MFVNGKFLSKAVNEQKILWTDKKWQKNISYEVMSLMENLLHQI